MTACLKIIYEGDITPLLRENGTQCAFWLDDDGDTRLIVEAHRGLASADLTQEEFEREAEPLILQDAAKNGRIKSHVWIYRQESKTSTIDDKINELLLRDDCEAADFWEHYPDETREAARLVKQKLWCNMLITDVYKRLNAHIPNTRPEHAIAHKLWAELTCATIILAADGAGTGDDEYGCIESGEVVPNVAAVGPLMLLRIAQTYLWTEKTERLARAAPLPKHTISKSVLPSPVMFWARETPHGNEWINTWLLVADVEDHIFVAHDAVSNDGQATGFRVMNFQINYGATYPDDFSPDDLDLVGNVLKCCAFLNSPYVTNEKHKVGRHVRRQMQRADQEPPDDDVSVVTLRRMQVRKPQPQSGEHPGVEWKHHWWVSSFYRAQWYPSEQAHRVIWIESFLKGDLSKPLLEKVYAVKR